MESHPYHLLVIIASDRVELLLQNIHKGWIGGISSKWHRFIYGVPILITFPSIFDMGKRFKDHETEFFTVRKFLDRVIIF